jgi:hypothetical protein
VRRRRPCCAVPRPAVAAAKARALTRLRRRIWRPCCCLIRCTRATARRPARVSSSSHVRPRHGPSSCRRPRPSHARDVRRYVRLNAHDATRDPAAVRWRRSTVRLGAATRSRASSNYRASHARRRRRHHFCTLHSPPLGNRNGRRPSVSQATLHSRRHRQTPGRHPCSASPHQTAPCFRVPSMAF